MDADALADLSYFESELKNIIESSETSVLQKRDEADCADPLDEIDALHNEIEQLESNLQRATVMASIVL